MSVKVISTDAAGKPKTYFFTDTVSISPCSCSCKKKATDTCTCNSTDANDNKPDNGLSIGEQSRQRMIQRSKDAWKS